VQHGKAVAASAEVGADRFVLKAKLYRRKMKESRRQLLGSLVKAPVGSGPRSFTVKLNKHGKAVFKKHQQLKLELVVAVVPPQGSAATITKKVTLKH
jgi:hypothetical protein